MIGDVWEWTASDFGGYPGFVAYPYREYSEVFFGTEYKVLRGGSWATRPRVSTPTFRNWDYPSAARSSPACASPGTVSMRSLARPPEVQVDSWLTEDDERSLANDVLDGLTKPFKELAAQALLRRPRVGAVRADLRDCPSTTRPAPSWRSCAQHAPRDRRPQTGAGELVELGSGASDKARVLLDAMARAPARCVATSRSTSPAASSRTRPACSSTTTRGSTSTAWSATSSATSSTSRSADGVPRLVALLGGTIGNFPPGTRRGVLRQDRRAARPRRSAAARHRPGQGPAVIEAAYNDSRRASPPSSTATAARHQP